jgi:2-amino-4-hydroxy-6-hydroxymethyldihydropteridine diphosphokinase
VSACDVYVAVGSNVDAVRHLQLALRELRELYPELTVSPAYRNKAVGFEGDDFVNLAVGFRTSLTLAQVREQLQKIEAACGRAPDAPKWAPRSMDLDILLFGDLVSNQPGLVVPRPDLVRRPYMLKPMADIGPDVVHPVSGKTMRELWEAFDSGGHEMVELGKGLGISG